MRRDPFVDEISVQEAAELLSVSRPTVYRLMERGELPFHEHPVTRRRKLRRSEVLRLLGPISAPYPVTPVEKSPIVADRGEGFPYGPRTMDGVDFAVLRGTVAGAEDTSTPAEQVDSIFLLPNLRLDFGVDDLSERVDYYRRVGVPEGRGTDATRVSGYLGSVRDEREHGSASPGGRGPARPAPGD